MLEKPHGLFAAPVNTSAETKIAPGCAQIKAAVRDGLRAVSTALPDGYLVPGAGGSPAGSKGGMIHYATRLRVVLDATNLSATFHGRVDDVQEACCSAGVLVRWGAWLDGGRGSP